MVNTHIIVDFTNDMLSTQFINLYMFIDLMMTDLYENNYSSIATLWKQFWITIDTQFYNLHWNVNRCSVYYQTNHIKRLRIIHINNTLLNVEFGRNCAYTNILFYFTAILIRKRLWVKLYFTKILLLYCSDIYVLCVC